MFKNADKSSSDYAKSVRDVDTHMNGVAAVIPGAGYDIDGAAAVNPGIGHAVGE